MLLAWWFLALLIGAAAAVPVLGGVFGVRRRRRRRAGVAVVGGWRLALRRLTLVFGTVTFGLAATAAAVNDHYSYIPSFHALFGDVSPDLVSHPVAARSEVGDGAVRSVAKKAADHGTVEKVPVAGPVSGIGARDTYVYLPPEYFDSARAAERFPVLYLLHGSPGISVDWLRAGWLDRAMDDLLAKHEIAPFIVVLPDVNGGYRRDTECEDIPGGPHAQTYLVRDVVDYVDANYRTVPNRAARVIGGLSTGGYCALNLVLRHQDTFSGIVSHSGYDRPDHNVYTGDLFGSDAREERANIPGQYLPTIPLTRPLGVYLDVGMSDGQSRSESTELAGVFERRGVPVAFHDFADEAHSWLVWRRNLFSSLPWVSSWFASTGVAVSPEPGDTAVLAAPGAPATAGAPGPRAGRGPEAAPTDSALLAPPDDLHIEGPAAAAAAAPAATIERHLPPLPAHSHRRLRSALSPSPARSASASPSASHSTSASASPSRSASTPAPAGKAGAAHRPVRPSAGRAAMRA